MWASGAQRVLPCEGWGVTASQLDLPSLDLPSLDLPVADHSQLPPVAGCGLLQQGATHWAILQRRLLFCFCFYVSHVVKIAFNGIIRRVSDIK